MNNIQMVDLKSQYLTIKNEIDAAIMDCINTSSFIKGSQVVEFQSKLEEFLNVNAVIACANGTDALQIAMMSLGLKKGDEVIVPAFTYVATAEVIGLLGLTPVMIDVDPHSFNITAEIIRHAITNKTKLIVPVHLFGQCANMEDIINLAKLNDIKIIEDTAQALGSDYTFSDGTIKKAGSMGDIGCTSFFPSKNLGCFGDGGAMYTNDELLANKLRMIANHGQTTQYTHDVIGVNSRLDTIQAAILLEKLKYLNDYNDRRRKVANYYDIAFKNIDMIEVPHRSQTSTHVFHQYTIKVKNKKRDKLKEFLKTRNIPSMVYYPKPLHFQKAYQNIGRQVGDLSISEQLCQEVLSLPIHTEMDKTQLDYIIENIILFFNEN